VLGKITGIPSGLYQIGLTFGHIVQVMPETASIEFASEERQAGFPTRLVPADGLATVRVVSGVGASALYSLEVPTTAPGILLPLRLPHADTFAES